MCDIRFKPHKLFYCVECLRCGHDGESLTSTYSLTQDAFLGGIVTPKQQQSPMLASPLRFTLAIGFMDMEPNIVIQQVQQFVRNHWVQEFSKCWRTRTLPSIVCLPLEPSAKAFWLYLKYGH